MGLTNGELVGIAAMREFLEEERLDIELLRDQLFNDELDDDFDDLSRAALFLSQADDSLSDIINRHDKVKEKKTSTALVPVKQGDYTSVKMQSEESSMDKKLTEMTPAEIGEGTVLFDPAGEAWIASLWTENVLDLKNGNVTKANVKPKDLEGWSFDGQTLNEKINALVVELEDEAPETSQGFRGWITAEVVKRNRQMDDPLSLIRTVNKILDKSIES